MREICLFFCAGLFPTDGIDRPRIYAIGYFTVQEVHDLKDMSPHEREIVFEDYPSNAHIKRKNLTPDRLHPDNPDRDRYPVIVVGDPDRSRLLDQAVPLSSPTSSDTGIAWYRKYRPLGTAESILGLNSTDLKRSNPKKVRGKPPTVRGWLDGNVETELNRRFSTPKVYGGDGESGDTESDGLGTPKLRSYVVATDSGFAPHAKDGIVTLATCKPMIRSSSEAGDWVAGFGGEDHESSTHIVYAFRVEHTMSMNEYFTDERFESRRPTVKQSNPYGDNIYIARSEVDKIETVSGSELPGDSEADPEKEYERGYFEQELCYTHQGAEYFQLAGGEHHLGHYQKDVEKQGDQEKVLISSDYYYFGGDGVEIPEEIAKASVPNKGPHNASRNHRVEPERVNDISPLVNWLRNNFRPGKHGEPASRHATLDPSETSGPGC